MKRLSRGLLRSLSIVFAALPLAFAAIRAVQTGGRDLRYILVALAAWVAAAAIYVTATRLGRRPQMAPAFFFAVFTGSTVVAIIAALLIGTVLGPGILVVGSAFGFCLAAACLLQTVAEG